MKIPKDKAIKILWKDKEKLSESQNYNLSTLLNKDGTINELYKLTQDIKAINKSVDA